MSCGVAVDARGFHGLVYWKSLPCHICHSQLSDIISWKVRKAQIPASKEPIGLSRLDGKRPDGATFIPCSCHRHIAWDVTVPDTFAASHIEFTSTAEAVYKKPHSMCKWSLVQWLGRHWQGCRQENSKVWWPCYYSSVDHHYCQNKGCLSSKSAKFIEELGR